MIKKIFDGFEIAGIACCAPQNKKSIYEYRSIFGDEKVDKFSKMTGIVEKREAVDKQTASDLCFISADELIKRNNIDRSKIGILLFATQTPDYQAPSSAFVLHYRLGLSKNCICYDVNLGCSAFAPCMMTVLSIMENSSIEYGMFLFGDTVTKNCSPLDKSFCMLFGDAGGVVLIRRSVNSHHSIKVAIESDGRKYPLAIIRAGGARHPDEENIRKEVEDGNIRGPYDYYMDGPNVFGFTMGEIYDFIMDYLNEERVELSNYDKLVLHQANLFIIKNLAKKLKYPVEDLPISIDRFGNTAGVTIPITIVDCYGETGEDSDKKLFMCGFGVGFSWGIVDAIVNPQVVLPMIYSDDYFKEEI